MSGIVGKVIESRDDILLFALSTLIALLLFGQLQSGMEPGKEREFEVPLSFSNQGDEITVLQAPRSVRIVASGSQQALDTLDTSKVRASVDLAEVEPGVGRHRVDVIGPTATGLQFRALRPNVEIELEAKLRKRFEIKLFTVGTPPGNYTYSGSSLDQETVEVSGPESNVPQVKSVRALLDLTTIQPNQEMEVDLEALGEGNRPVPLITLTPARITVRPAISVGPSSRRLLVTPVFSGQPAVGYRVTGYTVSPNQVEASGESADVSRITTLNTEAISLSGLRATRTFRVRLVVPEGLGTVQGEEVTVTVQVERA